MKLVSFRHGGRDRFGAVVGDGVVDFSGTMFMETLYPDLVGVFAANAVGELRKALDGATPTLGFSDITLNLPIPHPGKILCVGRNYRAYHEVQEMGKTPQWPSIFGRFVDSFVPHDAPLVKPDESDQLDYEGELAVVIGRAGRHIAEKDALSYIAGYTVLNEGSVRDWANRGTQNCPAKNFWHSGSIGPWIVTADEIPDPSKLHIVTRINGEVRQDGGTDLMIFSIPYVIAHISKFTWLQPGDIIATGSPGGSAVEMKPPKWMKVGDALEVDISGVGTLRNTVVAE